MPQSEIAKIYDGVAPVYDVWAWMTETRARDHVLRLARQVSANRILEVAVGTGSTFVELVRSNPNGTTTGIDLSSGMLRRAKRKPAGLPGKWDLVNGDALSLPFGDGQFDLLISLYMLDLLPLNDIRRALAEFHRVLRPDGKLILASMAHGKTSPTRIYEKLFKIFPRLAGGCRPLELSEIVGESGFSPESCEYVTQMLFPSEVISARRHGQVDPRHEPGVDGRDGPPGRP